MTRKLLLSAIGAVAIASLSASASWAGCPGHTADTAKPLQTADISSPGSSGASQSVKQD